MINTQYDVLGVVMMSIFLIHCANGLSEANERMAGASFYVSTVGNDSWSGTLAEPDAEHTDGPFATLERARDTIRAVKQTGQLPAGGITVGMRGGTYPLATTFELTAEDSGTPQAPIVYRAYQDEEVRLMGGVEIPGVAFGPLSDPAILNRIDEAAHGKVLQVDLKAQGITDYGEVAKQGKHMELFFQDRPMTLARWPNEGFVNIGEVVGDKDSGQFTYTGDRPQRWMPEQDIWLHGYWYHDWSDSYQRVASIDTQQRLISLATPQHGYGYRAGQRFYALNLLVELDQPGEWYLDRDSGILYFWPPAPPDDGQAVLSVLEEPIIRLNDASHVMIRNLIIECTRGMAVTVEGGTHNLIAGCTVRNTGDVGVNISGGTGNGVIACDIYETGAGGIKLSGGDRLTLTPAGHFARNNYIHHYSRWHRTYRPGVKISGVGNQVSHNLIHDAPHNAILLSGNEHLIEFNEIHHVCLECGDVGAFYMGRDWTARGTIIRYNFFHHLGGLGIGSQAVYLDDCASGITVFGNVFYKVQRAAFIGGGRDNTVENNIFVDCHPAVWIDHRGLAGPKWSCFTTMKKRLEAVNHHEPPYSERYPKLAELDKYYEKDGRIPPEGNVIVRNICVGGTWLDLHVRAPEIVIFQDNLTETDPGFVDPDNMNFQLKDDSPAYELGFQRIPMEGIGLYKDRYRTALPLVR